MICSNTRIVVAFLILPLSTRLLNRSEMNSRRGLSSVDARKDSSESHSGVKARKDALESHSDDLRSLFIPYRLCVRPLHD